MSSYKAVIFDIGGVVAGSPLLGIKKFEAHHGIPDNYLNWAIFKSGKTGAFQRVERGEVLVGQTFYEQFGQDVRNTDWIASFVENERRKGRNVDADEVRARIAKIDGQELWHWMMRESVVLDPYMLHAVRTLRKHGVQVAALTNNFKSEVANPEHPPHELEKEFDHFLESAIIGLRKPDPKIYRYTMKILNVTPAETIFLDDIGSNLASAKQLGITVIRVHIGKTRDAVEELSQLVGFPLLDPSRL